MKKRVATVITVCTTLIALLFMLSGCGSSNLSGRYINENNPNEYLDFIGTGRNRWVNLVNDGRLMDGTYRIDGNNLTISFSHANSHWTINNNRIICNSTGNVFVREGSSGFSIPWWGWVLVVCVGSGIISTAYKKITGREIDE